MGQFLKILISLFLIFTTNAIAEEDFFNVDDLESALKNDGRLSTYQTKKVLRAFKNKFGDDFKANAMFISHGLEFFKMGFPFGETFEDFNNVFIKTKDSENNVVSFPFNISIMQKGLVARLASMNFRIGFFFGKDTPTLKDLHNARFEGYDAGMVIPFHKISAFSSTAFNTTKGTLDMSMATMVGKGAVSVARTPATLAQKFLPSNSFGSKVIGWIAPWPGVGAEIHILRGLNRDYNLAIVELIVGSSFSLAKDNVIFKAVDYNKRTNILPRQVTNSKLGKSLGTGSKPDAKKEAANNRAYDEDLIKSLKEKTSAAIEEDSDSEEIQNNEEQNREPEEN